MNFITYNVQLLNDRRAWANGFLVGYHHYRDFLWKLTNEYNQIHNTSLVFLSDFVTYNVRAYFRLNDRRLGQTVF